jgi:hypothetical protein
MNWLTSLPAGVCVLLWLAVALLAAATGRVIVRAVVPAGELDQVQSVTAPLMPALGAAFAVMIAVTLQSEAGYLREAQKDVSDEAAAASRLAWAATSPGVSTEPIHTALTDYVTATRETEWRDDGAADGTQQTAAAIQRMETVVRAEAARAELGTPTSTELLASLDAVTSARRARLAAASRQIPVLYVVTLVAAGLALIANAGAMAARTTWRTSLLLLGLAVVVGLSLALLFALSAPWRGSLVVDGNALDTVLRDLRTGYFGR